MKKFRFLFIILCVVILAFKKGSKTSITIPAGWPKPAYNFAAKPLTPEKILLGRVLFYDPVLSRDSTVSCSSCHTQYSAFTHLDHQLSHGIEGRIGTRNAPAVMNLAWGRSFMWDGRVTDIQQQAVLPINHPDEMGDSVEHVVVKLNRPGIYPTLFFKAFGDSTATRDRVLTAISQFMLTLVSCDSRYDSVQRKQATFTEQETRGYKLFQQHCATCHAEPLFTNGKFENNGLPIDTNLNDIGRMKETHKPDDAMKFKVPTLRNLEYSYPYMHDGRFKKMYDVLNHYTSGISKSKSLSPILQKPILLNSKEKVDMVAFLLTLTDRHFLYNPDYSYPKNIFEGK